MIDESKSAYFPSHCEDCLEVAVMQGGLLLGVQRIHLLEPDTSPIQGDPKALLADWQKRLGLQFDEDKDMNLVRYYPPPEP